MKRLILLVLFLGMASVASGEVSTRVCLADGNTPFPPIDPNFPHVYPDIMVGTKLTIIIDSNVAEDWSGGLFIPDEDKDYGILWGAICLPAAGDGADALPWDDEYIHGFDLYTGFSGIQAGDWFVIDYLATSIGDCNVGFYDYGGPGGMDYPEYDLVFSHVIPDIIKDGKIDFADFALFASYWQVTDCQDWNLCEGADLDTDGDVDYNDLRLFVGCWLERTE